MRTAVPAIIASLVLAACGGSGSPAGGSTSGGPAAAKTEFSFETGTFSVPPGDSFQCIYSSTKTDQEFFFGNAVAQQAKGGHHVTVYYIDTAIAPTSHPCKDSEMAGWHQVAGAASGGEPVVPLPAGTGIRVPADKQIVIQAHYINSANETIEANDTISIKIVPPKELKQVLNLWVLTDNTFAIPAVSAFTSVTTCTATNDLEVVALFGHMHEHGKHFKLEKIDDKGANIETVYENDWQPLFTSHPPFRTASLDAPYSIKAGTKLRQTCQWNNTGTEMLVFPREMCVSGAFYFPDAGFLVCNGVAAAQ